LTANKPNKASFKKAVYETPDLLEVAKRDGMKLTPAQQAMPLNILVKNQDVFKGGRGYYNGKPVGIKLKEDARPYRAKPYPIPLKNRAVLKHEVARQCSVGCLGRLTPEEFEKREWAFPAFGIPKKNDTFDSLSTSLESTQTYFAASFLSGRQKRSSLLSRFFFMPRASI
jgi:hypothetical protein